ncbi:hypothetical protein PAPYR_2970 [Paratrimastix pyriformis]|uniref:Uncharacterized protein n=1 Tax=Paratrimastix pyriformis TaxID=342808 RepID=A0ABQ8UNI9_9EUKA|nr:hypothetical protein PAPYR_2970 [Paratrimastix pyriformis]
MTGSVLVSILDSVVVGFFVLFGILEFFWGFWAALILPLEMTDPFVTLPCRSKKKTIIIAAVATTLAVAAAAGAFIWWQKKKTTSAASTNTTEPEAPASATPTSAPTSSPAPVPAPIMPVEQP